MQLKGNSFPTPPPCKCSENVDTIYLCVCIYMSRVWGFVLGICFVLFSRLKLKINPIYQFAKVFMYMSTL